MTSEVRTAVDVYAYVDYSCPFSYVGDARLERVLGASGISARAYRRPLTYLDPDPEGEVGYDAEERERIRRELAPAAEELGLPFRVPETRPDPRDAFHAAEFAKDVAPDAFRRVHRALFRAVFGAGRDLGDRETLLRVCADAALDRRALRGALEDGRYEEELALAREEADRYGIPGTPGFLFGRYKVLGAVPPEVMRCALERAARDAGSGRDASPAEA